jgi:hypothetical protein
LSSTMILGMVLVLLVICVKAVVVIEAEWFCVLRDECSVTRDCC